MAVLQRRDPAKSATRLQTALGRDVEVQVVNRQVCVIMTPLAADQLATRLLVPKPATPRSATDVDARQEIVPAGSSDFAADVRELLPPLLMAEPRPIVRVDPPPVVISEFDVDLRVHLPALVFEDLPPEVVETPEAAVTVTERDLLEDLSPFGFENASPSDLENLPPFVHRDVHHDAQQDVSEPAADEPDRGDLDGSRDHQDRRPEWIRRVEGAVRDELDWYRRRH
jgi:hypothetical protein